MNVSKFQEELEISGVGYGSYSSIRSVDGSCDVVWLDGHPTEGEMSIYNDVLSSYDPTEYSISPKEAIIVADGVDKAVFTVTAKPNTSVDIKINDLIVEVVISSSGTGSLNVKSNNAGVLYVRGTSGKLALCESKVYAGEMV